MKANPPIVSIIVLSCLAASLFGCVEGKRKDSEASVYDQGVSRCQRIETTLKDYSVVLSGNASTLNDNDAQLSDAAKDKSKLVQIQPLLEDYVLTADRLLKLGDTAVVVFPERQKVAASRSRAVKYLGQVYAERTWAQKEYGMASSPDVDHAEYSARESRFFKNAHQVSTFGFAPESTNPALDYATVAKKMNTAQLKSLSLLAGSVITDANRMQELLEKNSDWQDKSLTLIKSACEPVASFMYLIRKAIGNELEARNENLPGI